MYDTIVLEANASHCVKLLSAIDDVKSERLLVDKGEQGVVFVDFIAIENLQTNDNNDFDNSGYKAFDSGFLDEITILLNSSVIKKITIASHYKIFFKKMSPDFDNEQFAGFSTERLAFIKNSYARIFSYVICIEDNSSLADSKKIQDCIFNKGTIYTALSEKGFILGDVSAIKNYTNETTNLWQAFTTTELAEELFQAGLMILSWGMTSYQYFIGFADNMPSFITNDSYKTEFYGQYKIKKDTRTLSLIKGELISDFNRVDERSRHKLKINNTKDIDGYHYISLRLYIIDIDSCGQSISPVCFLLLDHLDHKIDSINPALNYDIFT